MSKLMMFDFECPDGHVFEELVKSTENTYPCPYCTKKASRQISGTRIDWKHMGIDAVGFPSAGAKWEKAQRHKAKTDNYSPNLKMY